MDEATRTEAADMREVVKNIEPRRPSSMLKRERK